MKKKLHDTHAEKVCLNCGYELSGPFCSQCGQKVLLHKDSFWHLLVHFVSDYFHYDGKFAQTVKALFSMPGKITGDFTAGKRSRFLNPIQLYLFVSAIFLFVFTKYIFTVSSSCHSMEEVYERYPIIKAEQQKTFDTSKYVHNPFGFTIDKRGFQVNNKVYTLRQYDSIEASLPANQREGGLHRSFHRKLLKINDKAVIIDDISSVQYPRAIYSSLPKALFILLPIFAFLLKLFFRRRPYADHIIFSLHFHTMVFLMLTVFMLTGYAVDFAHFDMIGLLMLCAIVVYLYIALFHYTGQKWLPLTLKFIALGATYTFILLMSAFAILILSIFLM
ncbi:MAG: DUF3667 domain-containing protein [Chitinophagaceae bacterium]|nr:DUF3667 domain-containing protein [Chitinophagaceae bacterium]